MTDIIASWIYLDGKGEESNFPQVGGLSSSEKFHQTFWKCLVVFYESSLRFNKGKKHMLFTNSAALPVIDKFDLTDFFAKNDIEVVQIENEFKLPTGYHENWNNQFYEFSILNYLAKNVSSDFILLLLDSDCIFNASTDSLFRELEASERLAYTYLTSYTENQNINGLTRVEMQSIFKELGVNLDEPPYYSGGEIFFAKSDFIKKLIEDFENVWSDSLKRFKEGKIKFNEEAHVLSYYYYKFNTELGKLDAHIKRLWTNPLSFRNITPEDYDLDILHLPAEKRKGISDLYDKIIKRGLKVDRLSDKEYQKVISGLLSPYKFYLGLPKQAWSKFVNS